MRAKLPASANLNENEGGADTATVVLYKQSKLVRETACLSRVVRVRGVPSICDAGLNEQR